MSERIVVLNYVPEAADVERFSWADAILHPGVTEAQLWSIAAVMSWRSPLKVFLPASEPVPQHWRRLQQLWEEEWLFPASQYTVREDPRCRNTREVSTDEARSQALDAGH